MKNVLYKIIRRSGLPFLFRELIQRNKVTVLLFHDIDKPTADMAFSFLSKTYNVIHLDTLIEAIEKKDRSMLPPKALVITFDDGHIGNYGLIDTLKKYKISITIFLCAAIVNTRKGYWFKHPAIQSSREEMKKLTTQKRLAHLATLGFEPEKEYEEPQALQREQIERMKPYVNFQAHTMYHPILPMCNDSDAGYEIAASKQVLEEEFGLPINTISYPNGDYSDRDIALSRKAGYRCGITVDYGFNTIDTDIFRLKRISISDTPTLDEVSVKASGVWAFFKTRNGRKQAFGYKKETAA